jgi:hypothetical protein
MLPQLAGLEEIGMIGLRPAKTTENSSSVQKWLEKFVSGRHQLEFA